MDIPVFHDDQHGTAIIAAAGLINALALTGRDFKTTKLVCNGAGAAAIACIELIKAMGFNAGQRHPLRHQGRHLPGPLRGHEPVEIGPCRQDGPRTLAEAMDGADVVFGLSPRAPSPKR
jgi:malate dehydrogenase (oxaloacetate-decarboxylating)(NADP+)